MHWPKWRYSKIGLGATLSWFLADVHCPWVTEHPKTRTRVVNWTILADHTAACSMVVSWHGIVCLSVCLSLTLCIVTLRVGVKVESYTLVFLIAGYTSYSLHTFAAGCIYFSHNTQRKPEKPKFSLLSGWTSHAWTAWSRDHGYSRLDIFGGSVLQYTVRSTIGLLSDSYAACIVCPISVYMEMDSL